MPGFDGTGPLGQGPLTGGGRGFCVMPLDHNKKPFNVFLGLQNYPSNILYLNPWTNNSFINSQYPYYTYKLRSSGCTGSSGGYLEGRGGRGARGKGRRF